MEYMEQDDYPYYDEEYDTDDFDIDAGYMDDDSPLYDEYYYEEGDQGPPTVYLPVFLAVACAVVLLIFALSRASDSTPETLAASRDPDERKGVGTGNIAPLFTPEVQHWSMSIAQWSRQTGIDANLIATVMQIESCGDPFAKSSAGAMGLFQVMPYHFESGEDPYKPATNAQRGLNYLERALAARDGVVRLGFAGYNGGITGAKRPESQWANETKRYVYWGTGIYEDAARGRDTSERLNEWLERGGKSLCRQAAQRLGINQ